MTFADTFDQWRSTSSDYFAAQVEAQLTAVSKRLQTSGETLETVAKQLSDDSLLSPLAPIVTAGATRVGKFAHSLGGHRADHLWKDAERYARKRPWVATLAATVAGFAISRAVKAAATR
jgi:hypothetical protein